MFFMRERPPPGVLSMMQPPRRRRADRRARSHTSAPGGRACRPAPTTTSPPSTFLDPGPEAPRSVFRASASISETSSPSASARPPTTICRRVNAKSHASRSNNHIAAGCIAAWRTYPSSRADPSVNGEIEREQRRPAGQNWTRLALVERAGRAPLALKQFDHQSGARRRPPGPDDATKPGKR